MFAITSEPQALATEAELEWEMQLPAIGDPHHEIRKLLKERGLLDVFYNEDYGHLRERAWASHPNGYYQPAVMALSKSGRVLYRWRCVPKYNNMSGAGARPEARYTWEHMQTAMDKMDDAEIDKTPLLGAEDLSWPKFLLILTAHGWFLRPRAFPLARAKDKHRVSPGAMMPRVYGFIGLWLLALLFFPIKSVGIAALIWMVALTPGLFEIHRQFQNEPDEY
ncbi:MAG: hypothetical protein AAF387_14230 [Pseudomonadota bacterium]